MSLAKEIVSFPSTNFDTVSGFVGQPSENDNIIIVHAVPPAPEEVLEAVLALRDVLTLHWPLHPEMGIC
eukprot:984433-Rhodomonas_salina.4